MLVQFFVALGPHGSDKHSLISKQKERNVSNTIHTKSQWRFFSKLFVSPGADLLTHSNYTTKISGLVCDEQDIFTNLAVPKLHMTCNKITETIKPSNSNHDKVKFGKQNSI